VTVVGAVALITMAPATHPGIAYFLVDDDVTVSGLRAQRQSALVEFAVADCMLRQGLQYTRLLQRPTPQDQNLAPRDWTAKYGFGATTRLNEAEFTEPDPNLELLERLPAKDQEAYRLALLGDETEGRPGCRHEAISSIIAPREREIDQARALLEGFSSALAADPGLREAEVNWSDCARAAGFPTTRQEAALVAQRIFSDRLASLPQIDGRPDAKALAALQAEERAVALALFDCDASFVREVGPINERLSSVWISDHRAELEALRARLLKIDEDLKARAQERGVS
jgi:hypothetical protein